jgi:hypothetical protein
VPDPTNADELVAAFDALEGEIKDKAIIAGMNNAIGRVYNRMMANVNGPRTAPANSYPVPVRTADLRNGIGFKNAGKASGIPGLPTGINPKFAGAVYSSSAHSILIHDGHAEEIVIKPVRAKALKFKVVGSIQTHYKRGEKAGQKLSSPKIKYNTLYRKKVVLPPAAPRPFADNARNTEAENASDDVVKEVIKVIEAANGRKGV